MKNREIKVVLQEEAVEELEYFTIKVVCCPCRMEDTITKLKQFLKELKEKPIEIITPVKPCGCEENKNGKEK